MLKVTDMLYVYLLVSSYWWVWVREYIAPGLLAALLVLHPVDGQGVSHATHRVTWQRKGDSPLWGWPNVNKRGTWGAAG